MANQYDYYDWELISFNELSKYKKRDRLLLEANYACTQCGFNKRRPDNDRHILELDHIDGNNQNWTRENLRILCPNCHAMTPFFRNHGRTKKRKENGEFPTGAQKMLKFKKNNKLEIKEKQLQEYKQKRDASFITEIQKIIDENSIDFTQRGWLTKLSQRLNASRQLISKNIKYLMPEFDRICYRSTPRTRNW